MEASLPVVEESSNNGEETLTIYQVNQVINSLIFDNTSLLYLYQTITYEPF